MHITLGRECVRACVRALISSTQTSISVSLLSDSLGVLSSGVCRGEIFMFLEVQSRLPHSCRVPNPRRET